MVLQFKFLFERSEAMSPGRDGLMVAPDFNPGFKGAPPEVPLDGFRNKRCMCLIVNGRKIE